MHVVNTHMQKNTHTHRIISVIKYKAYKIFLYYILKYIKGGRCGGLPAFSVLGRLRRSRGKLAS